VNAKNATGNSPYSNVASISTPPLAPTNLTLRYHSGPQIQLLWTDNASKETGYSVERSADGVNFSWLASVPVNSTTYVDGSVVDDTVYYYRVYAFNLSGNSGFSNVASITTPPLAPSNVRATASRQGGWDRVILTWVDNSLKETSFQIQFARNANFTQSLVTVNVGSNITTFNTGYVLFRNANYYFRIRAVNATGPSVWVNATPFPIRTP
jgi:predicted phage tail protein